MEKETIKWLYAVPKRKKLYILALTIVTALHGAGGVFYALFLRDIVNSAIAHEERLFWKYVIWIVTLAIFQIFLRALIRFLTEFSKATFENVFKQRLMENILRKDFASVSAVHSGEWLNRLTNDTAVVSNSYVDIIPGIVGMVVKIISAIIMMLVIDWRFTCIILPCSVLLIALTYSFRMILKKLHKQIQEKDGKLRIFLQEHISSLLIVRTFSNEKQIENEASQKMIDHKNARMKRNRFSSLYNIGFGLAMDGLYIFGVCYCGYGILMGTITYGTLTAITQLISQIQSPFANITGYLPRFYSMIASADRLMEIEHFASDQLEEATSIKMVQKEYEKKLKSFGLKNASFTYYAPTEHVNELSKNNMPTIIENYNLEIKKGEYVALIGHSGCGKSTVLKLLMSIYELDKGKRFLKNNDNTETELTAKWRNLFAYVPQGNVLMSGTIREVVSFADRTRMNDDTAIHHALKIACADEFVAKMENGVDSLLGERGTGLSEGQMQRITIARAIFSDRPILLLDEATSALDEKTEQMLLQNLRKMTDKTVVIVTHRESVFQICDRVIELIPKQK